MATEIKPERKVKTYVSQRYLDIGENKREPGQLVPEVPTWFRYEHLISCGYVKEIEVPEEDFVAAVQEYCPELARELSGLVNITIKKLKGSQ